MALYDWDVYLKGNLQHPFHVKGGEPEVSYADDASVVILRDNDDVATGLFPLSSIAAMERVRKDENGKRIR